MPFSMEKRSEYFEEDFRLFLCSLSEGTRDELVLRLSQVKSSIVDAHLFILVESSRRRKLSPIFGFIDSSNSVSNR